MPKGWSSGRTAPKATSPPSPTPKKAGINASLSLLRTAVGPRTKTKFTARDEQMSFGAGQQL
jgi:hypothetical protein